MTTYDIDSGALPSDGEWRRIYTDEVYQTANGQMSSAGTNGNRWGLTLIWDEAYGDRGRWARNLGSLLAGRLHRLRVDLAAHLAYTRAGAGGGGSITVTGANSVGATSIALSGTGNVTNWLRAGDYIEINSELKQVRQDVSLVAGAATVEIWPELHKATTGGEGVDIDTPQTTLYLDADVPYSIPARNSHSDPNISDRWVHPRIVASLTEDITI